MADETPKPEAPAAAPAAPAAAPAAVIPARAARAAVAALRAADLAPIGIRIGRSRLPRPGWHKRKVENCYVFIVRHEFKPRPREHCAKSKLLFSLGSDIKH